jgi:hypothetical protein
MSPVVHRLYISTFVIVVVFTTIYLATTGASYYQTSLEERFYHEDHDMLGASGAVGHGLGIIGTLMMVFGVSSYMLRKRVRRFRRVGVLKYWLEFHIFLCTLGPILVLFHTSFKFGGLVAISFWSMVAVVLSGVIGRFIYIQIPRTIQGRELSLADLQEKRGHVVGQLAELEISPHLLKKLEAGADSEGYFSRWFELIRLDQTIYRELKKSGINSAQRKEIMKLVRTETQLQRRIANLNTMRQLFKYWHVAHLPFALVMLVIMVIHVGVTLAFGYKWIF